MAENPIDPNSYEAITAGVDERSEIPPPAPVDAVVPAGTTTEAGDQSYVGSVNPTNAPANVPVATNKPGFFTSKKLWWMIGGAAVLIILAVVTIWYFMLGGNKFLSGEVTLTPTPPSSTTSTPSAIPTVSALSPLNLASIQARILIFRDSKTYSVDYDGKNEKLTTNFDDNGIIGSDRKCGYYYQNGNLYLSAIDESQEKQITKYPAGTFDGYVGDVGPGYGIQVLGVNSDCSKAIVVVRTADKEELYLIEPQKKTAAISLGIYKDWDFVNFVANDPVFLSRTEFKYYSLNTQYQFVVLYPTALPGALYSYLQHINSAGQLVYVKSVAETGDQPTYNQVLELTMKSGVAKEISAKGLNVAFESLSVSPNFSTVLFGEQKENNLIKFFTYNRSTGATTEVNQKEANGLVPAWLDNDTYLFEEHRKVGEVTENYIWKCSVSKNSCGAFATNAIVSVSNQ